MIIKRTILHTLQYELTQPEIIILLGPRQVGKTTLLKILENYANQQGMKTAFFDLEQPQILAEFNQSDQKILQKLTSAGQVIFLDEFQYVNNISKIFKAIYDSNKNVKIVCSGSSSLEIHKHLKESVAGRKFLYRIYPLTYSELTESISKYKLEDYLCFGGMPGLTDTDSKERKKQILNELLSSYILKDVKSLIKEENIRAFNHLLYLLAEKQGSMISVNSLSSEVGLSSKSVNHYLDILEQTYVNQRIYSYSTNLGNELKKSCKTYLYDLGIRNMLIKDFSVLSEREDSGIIYESFVFFKLQTLLAPNMDIRFWRTKDGAEVDFVLLIDRKPIPIEVKSKIKHSEIPSGIKRFLLRYPKVKTAYIINSSIDDKIAWNNCILNYLSFEQFSRNFKPLS